MDKFIEALKNFEINEIIPAYKRIEKHLEDGYLTNEDYFFLEYCHPLIKISTNKINNLKKKENKNGRTKKII